MQDIDLCTPSSLLTFIYRERELGTLAQLRCSFALTPSLPDDTRIPHFAVKLFQCYIKGDIGIYYNVARRTYQRDRPVSR